MIKAVILVAQNFQDEEFVYPYYRMLEEGWEVDVATPDGKDKLGKYGVPARATKTIKDLAPENYSVVFLPGGFESPDRLRMLPEVKSFVNTSFRRGNLIAAICHGPWICVSAGIVKGMNITGYESIKDDLINAGGSYHDTYDVVRENNLITAPHYRNNPEFMRAVVNHVKEDAL